ncbi:4Fe-4S binding protein [Clostridium sp. SYSU_GA19001]|uniref:DUF362 domain-containing protein n=1 Tax=Clostridium caldaquaticum TaxID=2940653 RepID=UPI0020775350|nr:NADH-ubiquinone oxidoreductase-F iron-sulfur binding region domain-containing protein [Clostridium caldaquaticum]MCM8711253.1 4Fe-4S binding protein [Clostridium caldaquaticum]
MKISCEKTAGIIPVIEEIDKEDFCVVEWCEKIFDKARKESCGKCVLCREGTTQIYKIINDAAQGRGEAEDIELLKELSEAVKENSSCELARTAADKLLLTLEEQEEEWEMHIKRKRCSSLVCKKYITIHVLPEKCQGCGECKEVCPENAIAGSIGMIHVVSEEKCSRCLECIKACKYEAIQKAGAVKPKTPEAPVPVGSFEEVKGRRRRRGV